LICIFSFLFKKNFTALKNRLTFTGRAALSNVYSVAMIATYFFNRRKGNYINQSAKAAFGESSSGNNA
jgi:hypothetical protein